MNIFRFIGDMLHLAAIVLLPFKMHTSRSAAGVSLKTQELYLLVFLTRYVDLFFHFISVYNTAMKIAYITLTATTVVMMRRRPALKASYDPSVDPFRHWLFAVIPSLVINTMLFSWTLDLGNRDRFLPWNLLFRTLWSFSEVLEPFAIVPQLILFRRCTDAGRLAWVYTGLLACYRGLYCLNWVWRAKSEARYVHSPLLYTSAGAQALLYVVFLLDRVARNPQYVPSDEVDIMESTSSARERLLVGHESASDVDTPESVTVRASSPRRRQSASSTMRGKPDAVVDLPNDDTIGTDMTVVSRPDDGRGGSAVYQV